MDIYKKTVLLIVLLVCISFATSSQASKCKSWVAMAISVQGVAEQRIVGVDQSDDQSSSRESWQSIKRGDTFCPKDILRVRENSRVALILSNDTVVRLDENTTISFSSSSPDTSSSLDLKAGIAHFISRVKQAFKVITPFVNASIEGTEFVVTAASDQAQVTVFEGIVKAENEQGHVILKQGQTALALKGKAPVLKVLVKPRNAVQWALYYPTIISDSTIDPQLPREVRSKLAQSTMFNAEGKVTAAINEIDDLPDSLPNAGLYSYRAALRLAVGRVDKAVDDIELALTLNSKDSNALALKSMIAVVQNQNKNALLYAQQAIESDTTNVAAYLALSYAKQASLDLQGAQAAMKGAPSSARVHSRRAEVYLMQGDLDNALRHANKALDFNTDLSHTHTVLGFAHLIRIEIKEAKKAFNKAIHLEQTNPLAHMGLGIAMIRRGELENGRREIEYAASLDPNNALIRSYLGKAYFEEGRNKVAADQFDMAKALDPKDPTPWFYDAIRKQNENDPVGALTDLENSITRNDNRIVYRSRLMLDQDNASKGTNVGKIYSQLGFEQMAIQEAVKSLTDDPTNHSAHRFLADMYLSLPRHEIATTSEILQSQLMQPINTAPAHQRLSYGNLGTVTEVGSLNAGYYEYSSLFERNRSNINIAALTGGNDTKYYDVNYFGVYNNLSLSASIFDYSSEGYRINNDQDDALKNVLFQYAASPYLTVHFEFNERESRNGDIIQRFGDNNFDPNLREIFDVISERIGFKYSISPNQNVLLSHLVSERDFFQSTNDGFFFDEFKSGSDGRSTELQYISGNRDYDIISGLGYSSQDAYSTLITDFGIGPTVLFDDKFKIKHKNAYIHVPVKLNKKNTLIFAISRDSVENLNFDKTKTSPKFGYVYNSENSLTVRFAAFKTFKRPILADQTLEPTQIAGFNQFFDEGNGTEANRYGIGIDKKLNKNMFFGIEITKRELIVDKPAPNKSIDIEEKLHRAYLSWLFNSYTSLSAELLYEDFDSVFDLGLGDPKEPAFYTTMALPITLRFFDQGGNFGSITASYVDQEISFENMVSMGFDELEDSFTVIDFALGTKANYDAGTSKMQIVIGIKNIFDEEFHYQNTNTFTATPRPLKYYPERYAYGKIKFEF